MRLEDYWGIGPKTHAQLESQLGDEQAVHAIESADIRVLTDAGLSRGRATQILRRANSADGMDVLATRDSRRVYKSLLELASDYAVTQHAADQIRVLTPLRSADAVDTRVETVQTAMETWQSLDSSMQDEVLAVFDSYDSVTGGRQAAVSAALALLQSGATTGLFRGLTELDPEQLEHAAESLGYLHDGHVREGADDTLDQLRGTQERIDTLAGNAFDVLEAIREQGIRDEAELRTAVGRYLSRETGIDLDLVYRVAPDDAADAADYVGSTLRSLAAEVETQVTEREDTLRDRYQEQISTAIDDIEHAVSTIDHIALYLSLARFALAYDLVHPSIVSDHDTLAVRNARNLFLEAAESAVQPIQYSIGDHGLSEVPSGDRVAVLTGANSGGKTTLLEMLCQIAILAQMGLPVPADACEVSVVDSIVFHRRHASFNAGVLETTLKTIVPPLASGGRTMMLVDEFEAITEPGSAADLLHGLVTLTVDRDALGVFVTHLAEDLRPLPDEARIDGIFADGLAEDLSLLVDYQPRFNTVGRSTPEFIVSRLIANTTDRVTRRGYETLASALGSTDIQETLSNARWVEH